MTDIDIFGRKVFFVAQNSKVIPASFAEDFLSHGFETYFIQETAPAPLKQRIARIAEQYPESLLLIYVDSDDTQIQQHTLLPDMLQAAGNSVRAGLLYRINGTADQEQKVSALAAGRMLVCGCTGLGDNPKVNFEVLCRVLDKGGAGGRRTMVRAVCDDSSAASFALNGKNFNEHIIDVNTEFFSCDVKAGLDSLPIYGQLHDVKLSINGLFIKTDAVLIMKRASKGKNLFIFMFTQPDGSPHLSKETHAALNKKIYAIVTAQASAALQ